jgi:tellurite resistance protein
MRKDMFHQRERAEEAAYFQQRDAKLLEALRQGSQLATVAHALAEKLQFDEPKLLEQIKQLGVTLETGAAFILAPLIEVAWADGDVSHAERKAVLEIASRRGILPGSADHRQLLEWLDHRPSKAILKAALEAIHIGLSVLPPAEREQRVAAMIKACESVAHASGAVEALIEIWGIEDREREVITAIRNALSGRTRGGE